VDTSIGGVRLPGQEVDSDGGTKHVTNSDSQLESGSKGESKAVAKEKGGMSHFLEGGLYREGRARRRVGHHGKKEVGMPLDAGHKA
jgi:hypothetical protein